MKRQIADRPPLTVGVFKTYIFKAEPILQPVGEGLTVGQGTDIGLYGKKVKQVLQVERSLGDARKAVHNALQIAAHTAEGTREEGKRTHRDDTADSLVEDKDMYAP